MRHVGIVGAGIGGLTTAIALKKRGFEPIVFERAPELRAGGSGIILQPNAMLVMRELGLVPEIHAIGAPLGPAKVTNRKGAVLQEVNLSSVLEDAPTAVAVHREELSELLLKAADCDVRFDVHATGASTEGDVACLTFADGSEHPADAIIACDGLHSAIRRAIRGEETMRYAGYTTWRGIATGVDVQDNLTEIWGGRNRFGIVPLTGHRAYWFAVSRAPSGGTDPADPRDVLREAFGDFPPLVVELLSRTSPDAIIRTDMFDRPPIDTWVHGRVALLGDAAHPMTPNMGQGAGQAIEDALGLANALSAAESITDGLATYERCRRPRANWFVDQSWNFGRLAQVENGILQALRDLVIRATPHAVTRRSVEKMYQPVTDPGH